MTSHKLECKASEPVMATFIFLFWKFFCEQQEIVQKKERQKHFPCCIISFSECSCICSHCKEQAVSFRMKLQLQTNNKKGKWFKLISGPCPLFVHVTSLVFVIINLFCEHREEVSQ